MCKLKYLKLKFFMYFFKFIYIYYFASIILQNFYLLFSFYNICMKKYIHSLSQENYAIRDSFFHENRRIYYIYLDRKKNDISILHGFHVPRMVSALAKGFEDFSFGSHLEYRSRCREYRLKQRAILVLSLLKRTYFSLNRVRAKKNC